MNIMIEFPIEHSKKGMMPFRIVMFDRAMEDCAMQFIDTKTVWGFSK